MSMKTYSSMIVVDEFKERLDNYRVVIENHWDSASVKKKVLWTPGLRKMRVEYNGIIEVFDDDDIIGIAHFYNTGKRVTSQGGS
jgi:hypothetical protein